MRKVIHEIKEEMDQLVLRAYMAGYRAGLASKRRVPIKDESAPLPLYHPTEKN